MANPSKRKGSGFEKAVCEYLQRVGFKSAERRVTRGKNDAGDIAGLAWCLELKAAREIDLAGALDEAKREWPHAQVPWFAAVIKRRNKPVSEAYFVIPLWEAVRLMSELGGPGDA